MSEQQLRGAGLRETRNGSATTAAERVSGHRNGLGGKLATPAGRSGGERICQRAGCQHSATVTLSFRYDARQASLVDLSQDKDPAFYDLCDAHADVLIVPKGWERLDRRTPPPEPPPMVAGTDDGEVAAATHGHLDRYAGLTAELPRLAKELGVSGEGSSPARSGRRSLADADARFEVTDARFEADDARLEADDDPLPLGAAGAIHPFEPVTQTLLGDEIFELEGQLQMPIESEPGGVVVALTRTRHV